MMLTLFFGERLGLAFLPDGDVESFVANGVRYENTGEGPFTSFFDRFHDASGALVGIMLWCYPLSTGLGETLTSLPPRAYLEREMHGEGHPVFGISLTGRVEPAAVSGGEQAFGGAIYRNLFGEAVVSVDLDCLWGGSPTEDADLAVLQSAPVEWLTLTNVIEFEAPEA